MKDTLQDAADSLGFNSSPASSGEEVGEEKRRRAPVGAGAPGAFSAGDSGSAGNSDLMHSPIHSTDNSAAATPATDGVNSDGSAFAGVQGSADAGGSDAGGDGSAFDGASTSGSIGDGASAGDGGSVGGDGGASGGDGGGA